MRAEFVDQMEELRAKIFKRVKPKSLNGRNITGETLLELCEAYTQAINQGNVPCIESAWSYVCKNESLRAQQQSVQLYKAAISKHLSGGLMPDYAQLKKLHLEV